MSFRWLTHFQDFPSANYHIFSFKQTKGEMLQGKKYNPLCLLSVHHFISIIVILRQPARTEHFLSAGQWWGIGWNKDFNATRTSIGWMYFKFFSVVLVKSAIFSTYLRHQPYVSVTATWAPGPLSPLVISGQGPDYTAHASAFTWIIMTKLKIISFYMQS